MSNFNGWTNLDIATKACKNYATQPHVNGETHFHIVEANLTLRPDWQKLPNGNYMLVSNVYLDGLKKYWATKDPTKVVEPLFTAEIQK